MILYERVRAVEDTAAAVQAIAQEFGEPAARRFWAELTHAYRLLLRQPRLGIRRPEFEIEALRSWKIRRYPWIIFYRIHGERLEIIRVVPGLMDLPRLLAGEE